MDANDLRRFNRGRAPARSRSKRTKGTSLIRRSLALALRKCRTIRSMPIIDRTGEGIAYARGEAQAYANALAYIGHLDFAGYYRVTHRLDSFVREAAR